MGSTGGWTSRCRRCVNRREFRAGLLPGCLGLARFDDCRVGRGRAVCLPCRTAVLCGSRLVTAFNEMLLTLAEALRLVLESLSVLTVLLGLLITLRQALRRRQLGSVRLELGRWLSMALEFQLAADIVATTISPNGQQLIQLAAIALIRTFLNIALSREAQAEHAIHSAQR